MLRDGDPSSYLFHGTYHFFGRLLMGPHSHIPLRNGYKIECLAVAPSLRIGFTTVLEGNPDVPPEFRNDGVVTVTFQYGALGEAYV
jgi:hypothetical protein